MIKAHLFVLVHGLWGGAEHLKAIEEILKSIIKNSKEELYIIRPKSSSLFKTYDGIEIIGQRILLEILNEIKSLYEDTKVIVKKISFIGYSLGGLVSRYIIGELDELGIFDYIQPYYFTTFATPHMGTWFFKKRFKVLNILGSNLLGLVGNELFIKDKNKILVKLTKGSYINGLKKFKKRFLFANVRHDRTVNFYTSFITDKNPFDQHWDNIELSFDFKENLIPTYLIKGINVKPKIVNLYESKILTTGRLKQKSTWLKKFNYFIFVTFASVILSIWIPIILTASIIGSIVSFFVVKSFKKSKQINDLKDMIINYDNDNMENNKTENYNEYNDEFLKTTINLNQYNTNIKSIENSYQDNLKTIINDNSNDFEEIFNNLYENSDKIFKNSTFQNEIFNKTNKLPLNEDMKTILKNLNELDWYKFPVYINVLNAHDGIVARKGLKRSTIKGIATITFFAYMINRDLKGNSN